MIIKVTQDHIDHGHKGECCGCPIALAAMDAGLVNVVVGSIRLVYNDFQYETCLPEAARRFISEFDRVGRGGVAPFEFEIDI